MGTPASLAAAMMRSASRIAAAGATLPVSIKSDSPDAADAFFRRDIQHWKATVARVGVKVEKPVIVHKMGGSAAGAAAVVIKPFEVAERHYDIGNDFYSAWLDPSMTYSSALFEDHTHDLTAAQINKYQRLAEAIDLALGTFEGYVAYVDGADDRPVLHIKPLHVGPVLEKAVWTDHSAVLTSATVPMSLPQRVGLDTDGTEQLVVGSPFDYERNSRLYCSPEFPDRNSKGFGDFVHDELEALISAAGGRTLALFTSNEALRLAAEEMLQSE